MLALCIPMRAYCHAQESRQTRARTVNEWMLGRPPRQCLGNNTNEVIGRYNMQHALDNEIHTANTHTYIHTQTYIFTHTTYLHTYLLTYSLTTYLHKHYIYSSVWIYPSFIILLLLPFSILLRANSCSRSSWLYMHSASTSDELYTTRLCGSLVCMRKCT